jgi:hypothetical protein
MKPWSPSSAARRTGGDLHGRAARLPTRAANGWSRNAGTRWWSPADRRPHERASHYNPTTDIGLRSHPEERQFAEDRLGSGSVRGGCRSLSERTTEPAQPRGQALIGRTSTAGGDRRPPHTSTARRNPDRATPDDRLVVGRIPRDVRGDLGGGPILPRSFARIANLAIELPATRSPRSLRQTPVTSHTVNALRSKGAVRWSLCGQPRRDVSAAVCRSPPSTSRARHRFPRGSRRRTNLRLVAPLTLSANQ